MKTAIPSRIPFTISRGIASAPFDEQLARREVTLAVAHVRDQADDEAGVERAGRERDDRPDDPEDDAVGLGQHALDHSGDDEDRHRRTEQRRRVRAVELERLADHTADAEPALRGVGRGLH